ncbi:homeodomain-interacting protein kinase 4 [Caloenas nicobarica]|uniref:homeodomain-interacting protein kinase 4 n=1 Tax=Caloenas nicobarica TaxID=187106 RepID=UPI0032B72DEA
MGTLAVGTEHYNVVATVGKGTFGEVARGRRTSTGEMVAIKILRNDGHGGHVAKNELRLLRALRRAGADRSHVVRFLESFGDASRTYLVFELLQQNLFDFQKQNNFSPLPVRHIRTIATQVLVALVKLKELSIIHADLKPENIMLVDHARFPFRVKLIDFGSASVFAEVRHVEDPYIQSRFYRAPEILLGLPFCEKVDVWSLGCVLAELHLGWPLYPGADEHDQVRYICSTLGLPRSELLRVARKAPSFFCRVPHPAGSWQLKAPGEEAPARAERRKFVFSSLDQLAVVNIRPAPDPNREALAERCDLRGMVELVKRMLTWDSHKRIGPSAALRHPFISLQQLKASFGATGYYRVCQEDLKASRIVPSVQSAVEKMEGLRLGEAVGDYHQRDGRRGNGGGSAWSRQQRQGGEGGSSTVPGGRERWLRGTEHGAGRPHVAPDGQRPLVTPCDSDPPGVAPVPEDKPRGPAWDPPGVTGTQSPAPNQQHR